MTPNPPKAKTLIQALAECVLYLGVIAFCIGYFINQGKETPEEIAANKAQVLNNWFNSGSDTSCEEQLKKQLRDPNSYERDGVFTTPSNNDNEKIITWEFRSKNGFGGLTNGIGMCLVTKKDGGTVKATVLGQ